MNTLTKRVTKIAVTYAVRDAETEVINEKTENFFGRPTKKEIENKLKKHDGFIAITNIVKTITTFEISVDDIIKYGKEVKVI